MRKHMNYTLQLSINIWNKWPTMVAARLNLPIGTGSYPLRAAVQPARRLHARQVNLPRCRAIADPIERIDESGADRQHGGGRCPGAARADD